jgi:DNA topoisomerase IB
MAATVGRATGFATWMRAGFTAKDFRTWGGTLLAAIALAEHGLADSETEAKRAIAAVMRTVGERLGNTCALHGRHMSALRSSISISTGERSKISAPVFAVVGSRAMSLSTARKKRS